VRMLAIGGIAYLILGLVFVNYGTVFRDVISMFNSVADFIYSSVGVGDLFNNWLNDMSNYFTQNGWSSLFGLVNGGISGLLGALLIIVAFIIFPISYTVFTLFYALYGSILYVTGPLVLALLPANGIGQLARTYLVNMLIFQAWGILYAIFTALAVVLNVNSVNNVLNSGGVAGFFQNASQDLLLALASILFSICIALIPFLASRIIKGDVGSTVMVLFRSAMGSVGMISKM